MNAPDGPLSVLHALASEPTLARHSEEALLMTAADDLAVVCHGDGYGMHLTCSLISSAPGTSIANGRGVETCTTSEAACPSGSRFNATPDVKSLLAIMAISEGPVGGTSSTEGE